MQIKNEDPITSLPSNVEFFFKQITTTPQKELRFWCHLINIDYDNFDQLRLLTFLEEKRDDTDGAAKGCLLSMLGGLYIFTNSLHKNPRRGVNILREAAYLNNGYAINALGYMLHMGKKYANAKPLYELAIELGNPLAMNNLGIMHQYGQDIPVNAIEAASLYKQSWKLSYTQAKLNLKKLCSNHPQNYHLQYHLNMALTPGKIESLLKKWPLEISQCVFDDPLLNDIEKHAFFCSEEIKPHVKNCALLRDKMTHFIDMTLPANPEHLYEFGKQFEKNKNYDRAIFYYEKAAIKHHASSQYNIALIFLEGPENIRDTRKAKILLEKAVDLGNISALYKLGTMHHNGIGIDKDFKKAMSLYLKAEAGLEPKAICGLGVMHYFGQGTPVDHNEAVIFFRRAWKLSCPDAKKNLEKMRDRHKEPFIQYHCVMALSPREIHALYKKSEQEVGNFIIEDTLLTMDEKGELFFQFYYDLPQPQIQRSPTFFSQEQEEDYEMLELIRNNPHFFL